MVNRKPQTKVEFWDIAWADDNKWTTFGFLEAQWWQEPNFLWIKNKSLQGTKIIISWCNNNYVKKVGIDGHTYNG